MTDEPALFTAEAAHLLFRLFDDRIEVVVKKRVQVIPLGEIVAVSGSRRPKKLVVATADGKQYQYLLAHDVEAARVAVTSAMRKLQPAG